MSFHGTKGLLPWAEPWPHHSCAAKCWITWVTLGDAINMCFICIYRRNISRMLYRALISFICIASFIPLHKKPGVFFFFFWPWILAMNSEERRVTAQTFQKCLKCTCNGLLIHHCTVILIFKTLGHAKGPSEHWMHSFHTPLEIINHN